MIINMKKILSKLSFKLIILQIGFLHLFSQAADRFYYTLNYKITECFYISSPELRKYCFEKHPGYTISYLLTYPIYFMLYGLLLAMILIVFINRRKKIYFLNTLLICVIYVVFHLTGLFKFTRDLDSLLISFGNIFSDKFWVINIITVHIYLLCAVVLIWLSVKNSSSKKSVNLMSLFKTKLH